jgi:hypothetical protein
MSVNYEFVPIIRFTFHSIKSYVRIWREKSVLFGKNSKLTSAFFNKQFKADRYTALWWSVGYMGRPIESPLNICFWDKCVVGHGISGISCQMGSRHPVPIPLETLCVRAPRATSDDAPSPIKTPRRKKPK